MDTGGWPRVVGAVVGVDGESGIIADEAARHLNRIQSARLKLIKESAVEPVDVVHVAEETLTLLPAQWRTLSFFPPVVQVALNTRHHLSSLLRLVFLHAWKMPNFKSPFNLIRIRFGLSSSAFHPV